MFTTVSVCSLIPETPSSGLREHTGPSRGESKALRHLAGTPCGHYGAPIFGRGSCTASRRRSVGSGGDPAPDGKLQYVLMQLQIYRLTK